MAASKLAPNLAKYQEMRDFSQTAEPSGKDAKVVPSKALRFVIQKHAASHLHFDLRLEYEGTFRSWAVPKGPSLNPKDRRMAMEVEDHERASPRRVSVAPSPYISAVSIRVMPKSTPARIAVISSLWRRASSPMRQVP
jgi:hypothetical protein